MTKEIAAEVFGRNMELHAPSLSRIERYFAATGRVMTPNNRKQAMMPEGAIVFDNDYGTAPALALTNDEGKVLVLLPGPPRELEPLFREKVEPFLRPRCAAVLFSRNVHICGMGESAVEAALPTALLESGNPTVAPYCVEGEVRLRVTAKAADEHEAAVLCDKAVEQIKNTPVGGYIYAIDTPSPEAALIEKLLKKGLTVTTAESCTGGLIAKRLTDIAGSSAAVVGGFVTYQTHTKTKLLGVPAELIEAHGVVSTEVAAAMAEGARKALGADIAIATTGYAGPGGGDEQNPVGTVYIAVAGKQGSTVRRFNASPMRDRAYIRTVAATNAILDALHFLF
jgi:nicotinamide-nucleotide amidase